MLFSGFSNSLTELSLGLSGFAFLGLATLISSSLKSAKGLKLLWFGLFLLFFNALLYQQYNFLSFYGISFEVFVFFRLCLSVSATILFVAAASEILLYKPLSLNILYLSISSGLILSFYAVYISRSIEIQDNVETALPMIGLIYLFLAFISRPNLKKHIGEIFAAMSVLGLIEQTAVHLFLHFEVSVIFSVVLLFMLSSSYLLMLIEWQSSEKEELSASLQKMSKNMFNIIKSSAFPIIISKLKDDSIVFANQSASKLFELNLLELSRYHFKDLFVDAQNRKLLLEKLEHAKQVQDFEILVKSSIGQTPFWLIASANIIEYENELSLYIAFQDITERKQREKLLQNQADRDPLTSIYNRRYFENSVTQRIKQAYLENQNFAILMIDADHFKSINDKYGHKTGDKVLMELAHTIERSLRPEDVVARYGGEEFVVFLHNVSSDISLLVSERLRKSISQSVVYSDDNEPISWTVSIGIAPSGLSDSVPAMIKMADDAMYIAKQNGRNQVHLYDLTDIDKLELKTTSKELIHPVFKSEEEEISLLDGLETNHIIEE